MNDLSAIFVVRKLKRIIIYARENLLVILVQGKLTKKGGINDVEI